MSNAKVEFETLDYDPAQPGQERRFGFRCPNGNWCAGLLIRQGVNGGGPPSWAWDGNRESPTFSPSINCKGCWHGYIGAGRCVTVNGEDEPEHS
jgi:hypothetical protein